MVSETGTSTLGFIVWIVALTVMSWLSAVVHGFLKRRKIEREGAFCFTVRESLTSGLLPLAGVSFLAAIAWGISATVIIYQDHQDKAERIQNLQSYASSEVQMNNELAEAQAKANNWRDAYTSISKGEVVPDRILSREEIDKLHDRLTELAKNSGDINFVKIEIAPFRYEDRESLNFASQLFNIFKGAKWNVRWKTSYDKAFADEFNNSMPLGVVIYTDNQSKGSFIMWTLRDAGVDARVSLDVPAGFRGTMICVGNKQFP
jgi:hypothetical protein